MAKKKSPHAESKQVPPGNDGLRLATVRRVLCTEPYSGFLTERALRALIFDAEDRYSAAGEKVPGNGMAVAIIRLGAKVLIDLDAFDQWLASHRAAAFHGSERAHRATTARAHK